MILDIRKAKKDGPAKKISIMDHPEYKQEWDRLMALRQRITEVEKALNEINDQYSDLAKHVKDAHREALEETIRGGDPRSVDLEKNLNDRLAELRSQRRGLEAAEQEQVRRVNELRYKASAELCKPLKKKDHELGRTEALKFVDLSITRLARIDFLDELDHGNIVYLDKFVPLGTRLGNPRSYESRSSKLIRAYFEHGFLELSDIPSDWLERWQRQSGAKLTRKAV